MKKFASTRAQDAQQSIGEARERTFDAIQREELAKEQGSLW